MPNAMATTNTVLSCPINGRFVIASTGLNQCACITSSNPKILPNMNPKNVENSPAMDMIPARLIFLIRYKSPPNTNRHKPWPTSPNIAPKINVYVSATNIVGSISSFAGSPYIRMNISNGLKNLGFLSFVGGSPKNFSLSSSTTTNTLSSFFDSARNLFTSSSPINPHRM